MAATGQEWRRLVDAGRRLALGWPPPDRDACRARLIADHGLDEVDADHVLDVVADWLTADGLPAGHIWRPHDQRPPRRTCPTVTPEAL